MKKVRVICKHRGATIAFDGTWHRVEYRKRTTLAANLDIATDLAADAIVNGKLTDVSPDEVAF